MQTCRCRRPPVASYFLLLFSLVNSHTPEAGVDPSNSVVQYHRRLTSHEELSPNDLGQTAYGVDVTFPMHYNGVSVNYPSLPHNVDPEHNPTPDKYKGMPIQPFGNKQKFYDDFMQGCRDKYGEPKGSSSCDATESGRISMNLRQPQSMQNYTELGFKQIRAPENVFKLIKEFWDKNNQFEKEEQWSHGNTYTNHWDTNTGFVSVEDTTLRGAGSMLKSKIWSAAQSTLEEWTGEKLTPCSLYGVRVYKEGAVLATHVDRLPLVSSAIINVAQDLDEPWPLEVYGHDGKAYNVSMQPGDMVLYESHSVLHGRPFPLKGRMYANIFIHFEPVGHSERHGVAHNADVENQYRKAVADGFGGHENSGLPDYIIPGSPEESNWKRSHPNGWEPAEVFTTGSTAAHLAAQAGDVETLKEIVVTSKATIHKKDKNGWQPIHEGARGGHLEVVKLLVEHGADVNVKATGLTPLRLAKQTHGSNHPVVDFLTSIGALDLGPDL